MDIKVVGSKLAIVPYQIAHSLVYSKVFKNLVLKIFATFCKRLISKVSSWSRRVQVSVSSRLFAKSLGL